MSTEMQEQTTEVQVKDDLYEAPQTTLSEWEILRKNAEEKQCDSSAWDKLLEYAENLGDLERIKEAYEAILQKYPNTVRHILFPLKLKVFKLANILKLNLV